MRERLHQTSLVLLDLFNPVHLSCGDKDMGAEFLDVTIQRLYLVNLKLGRILHGAIRAVSLTIGAILLRLDGGKDILGSARAAAKRQQRAKHDEFLDVFARGNLSRSTRLI